ncbi:hypothetical protein CTRI78_v010901 [Colletotrichum trifolii]|uniref:Uncharacterized protein n=1 Tax=Colletotrichum trifolii TaxID=5466 RepID=A0A4R8QUJ0_COLTR|nr:hypothetical protein CTRI78_v010901 [Colletotrichum trifolii]
MRKKAETIAEDQEAGHVLTRRNHIGGAAASSSGPGPQAKLEESEHDVSSNVNQPAERIHPVRTRYFTGAWLC